MCSKEYIIQRKKYNVPEQRIIGKRSENNPDRMLPNETFVKYFGGQEMPEQKAGQTRSSCLRIGTFLVIQKILNGYKLPEILEKYLGKKKTGLFLDLAEYSCAVTPQVRQTGNRLSGLAGTAYASLLT